MASDEEGRGPRGEFRAPPSTPCPPLQLSRRPLCGGTGESHLRGILTEDPCLPPPCHWPSRDKSLHFVSLSAG